MERIRKSVSVAHWNEHTRSHMVIAHLQTHTWDKKITEKKALKCNVYKVNKEQLSSH